MAGSLNKALLIGNLTRDPEMRKTTSGQSVVSFGVATNRSWKGADGQKQEQTEFHNVIAWGKLAEICAQYLGKGRKVFIEGRLQTRDWEGQDGVKRFRTEIVADNMVMLDRAPASGDAPRPQFGSETENIPADDPGASANDVNMDNVPF